MRTTVMAGCCLVIVAFLIRTAWCRPFDMRTIFSPRAMLDDSGRKVTGLDILDRQGDFEIPPGYPGTNGMAHPGGRWRIVIELPEGALRVSNSKDSKIITIRDRNQTNKILASASLRIPNHTRVYAYYK